MGWTFKPEEKLWNETSVKAAVKEVLEDKKILNKTALKYHISFSTLWRRVLECQGLHKHEFWFLTLLKALCSVYH